MPQVTPNALAKMRIGCEEGAKRARKLGVKAAMYSPLYGPLAPTYLQGSPARSFRIDIPGPIPADSRTDGALALSPVQLINTQHS
jgi:hypothetical protein